MPRERPDEDSSAPPRHPPAGPFIASPRRDNGPLLGLPRVLPRKRHPEPKCQAGCFNFSEKLATEIGRTGLLWLNGRPRSSQSANSGQRPWAGLIARGLPFGSPLQCQRCGPQYLVRRPAWAVESPPALRDRLRRQRCRRRFFRAVALRIWSKKRPGVSSSFERPPPPPANQPATSVAAH